MTEQDWSWTGGDSAQESLVGASRGEEPVWVVGSMKLTKGGWDVQCALGTEVFPGLAL